MTNPNTIRLSLFNNATLNSLIYLVNKCGIKVTRDTVREKFLNFPSFPRFPLNDIMEAFKDWNVPTIASRTDLDTLRKLPFPLLAHLSSQRLGGRENDGNYLVITAVDANNVSYYNPSRGIMHASIEDFLSGWSGVVLLLEPVENSGESDFTSTNLKAEADRKNYENSMQQIDAFFSSDECSYLINYCNANDLFKQSMVFEKTRKEIVSSVRTSYSAVIIGNDDPVVGRLRDRVAELFNVFSSDIESLQVVRYSGSQYFDAHFDSNGCDLHRTYTALVYLNDNFIGGETFFPELDLRILPRTGKALVFRNLDDKYEVERHSLHAGLPVEGGTKFACNFWIRNRVFKNTDSH